MRLSENEHIILIVPAGGAAAWGHAVRRLGEALRARGVRAIEISAMTGPASSGRIWAQARRLRRVLKQGEPGVAVSFGVEDHLALATAGIGLPARLVLWQAEPPEWGSQAAFRAFWRLLPVLARRRNVQLAAPNAELMKRLAQEAGMAGGVPLRLALPLPDATAPMPGMPPDLRAREPVILFPAPVERSRQPGMAVRALGLLKEMDARLVMPAGGASERAIRHMISQLRLQDRVRLVPPREIGQWFDKARVCCLPPRMDAFAFEAMRALSHGLPVVGTRVPALEEIIGGDAALGALVDVTDTEGLSQALARYLRRPGDATARLRRARDFAPDKTAGEWLRALFRTGNV